MPRPPRPASDREEASSAPRIIGGSLRGRRLEFVPDPRTRPMKDRVRETLFDLVGARVAAATAIDLFAGSGAIGFEALSRGASRTIFVERHFPTADLLKRSGRSLGVVDSIEVKTGDVLLWAKRMPELPKDRPWVVFISPPWEFFSTRCGELMALVAAMQREAPPGSTFVVEADTSFDADQLPQPGHWDHRPIPPAVLHISSTTA